MDHPYPLVALVIAVLAALTLTTVFSFASSSWRIGAAPRRPALAPLMGGLAILLGMVAASFVGGVARESRIFLAALCMALASGLWIQLAQRRERLAAAIQIIAIGIAVPAAGMQVTYLGHAGLDFRLPPSFGVPIAVVAVMVVTYSVNRIEVPGFRAWFGFLVLACYAAIALDCRLYAQFRTALLLDGAIAGYLLFNAIRTAGNRTRRVDLGLGGGLMVGLAVSWIGLDLTQGPGRQFPPIAGLWIVLLPLLDTASVLLSRLMRGRDLFEQDGRHLHDYLEATGHSPGDILVILLAASVAFGEVGFFGWILGIPEAVLMMMMALLFVSYHALMTSQWRRLTGFTILS